MRMGWASCLSFSLCVTHLHTHTHTHILSHTHTLSLSLCMPLHSLSLQGLTAADMPMAMEAARQCPRLTKL
jgi:hypothetical protein